LADENLGCGHVENSLQTAAPSFPHAHSPYYYCGSFLYVYHLILAVSWS